MQYDLVSHLDEAQVDQVLELYGREWWSIRRQPEDVRAMLAHTDLLFGLVEADTGRLAAFSRVLTDFVYKALIFDVIVEESHRETGLGRRLLEAIVNHPRLSRVNHLELYCRPTLEPFYRKFGFTKELEDLTFMRLER